VGIPHSGDQTSTNVTVEVHDAFGGILQVFIEFIVPNRAPQVIGQISNVTVNVFQQVNFNFIPSSVFIS